MDIASEDDVLVHAKPLQEEFNCPICFEVFKNCSSTPCGHSFCEQCLVECLNVKKKCPTCNTAVDQKLVMRNKHIDRIITVLKEETTKAQKEQFLRLLAPTHTEAKIKPNSSSKNESNMTTIENILQKHLMKSLNAYDDYLQKLKTAAEVKAREERQAYESALALKKKENASNSELDSLKSKHQAKIEAIQEGFATSESLLHSAYETFLTDNLVNPSFLPVNIILIIEATGAKYPFVIEPTTTLSDIKTYLLTKPAYPNGVDLLAKISTKSNPIVIRPPFSSNSKAEKSSSSVASSINGSVSKEVRIDKKHIPVLQIHNIFPGSSIVMLGKPIVNLQIKECFRSTFSANDPSTQLCNYFTCTECAKSWICKDCADTCHIGHHIQPHLKDHQANWACCYCIKTGKCTLVASKK